jgi:predicted transcriptional regulator YheO
MVAKSLSPKPKPSRSRARDAEPPASVQLERDAIVAVLLPVVDVIGNIVGDNVEVVAHDLTRPEHSIIKIVNGQVSGRTVGDSILRGPANDKGFVELRRNVSKDETSAHSIITDYQTFTRDGTELRSSTVIFRSTGGTPIASLCVNVDLTVVFQAHALLQSMFSKQPKPEAPASASAPGIDVLMQEIIADSVKRFGKPVSMMSKEEKVHAVNSMLRRGLFIVKGGVERAASALGVTRFTIYNYLDVLKHRNTDPALLPSRPQPRSKRKP